MSDEKKVIHHRRANNFASVYASGAVSSLIPTSGMFNITFYEDVVGVVSETLTISETTVVSEFNDDSLEPHREDKVRVTMRPEVAIALCKLITDQINELRVADHDKGN